MMTEKSSIKHFSLLQLFGISTILWCLSIGWSTALSNIMMVITTILALLQIIYFKKDFSQKDWLIYPTTVLFILMAFSVIWSENFGFSISKLKSNLPYLLFPVTLFFWRKYDQNIIWKGLKILTYSLFIAYLITIFWNLLPESTGMNLSEKFSAWVKPFHEYNRSQFGWYVPFMERVHFSNLLAYSGIGIFFIYLQEKKVIQILLGLILLSGPFVLGARASMLGILATLPFLIWSIFQEVEWKKIKWIILSGLLVIGTVAYCIYPNIQARYDQTKYELEAIQKNELADKDYEHFTTYTRFAAWKVALQLFASQPVIGDGIGDHIVHYDKKYQESYSDLPICYHSQWLYFLGVFGFIGLIIFIISYLYFGFTKNSLISNIYFATFTIYTAIIWMFDTGLLQKKEMMAFVLFLFFTECLKKNTISST